MSITRPLALATALLASVFSAAWGQNYRYEDVKTGALSGKLTVQWLEPDLFLFLPDKDNPLTFTRATGKNISPGRMKTDGGSIPRPLWILRNYSPWGFAPAFIVHDWLYEMKHCKHPGFEQLTFEESALVMAEIMKTMITSKKVDAGPLTVDSMYAAVSSSVAQKRWNEGKCSPPQPGFFEPKPIQQFVLSF